MSNEKIRNNKEKEDVIGCLSSGCLGCNLIGCTIPIILLFAVIILIYLVI
ncbi:hypothetical protein ABET51_03775 [Metabacillus fastidiosus]